jgi:UDP-N-acetylmuramoylalanine--D-glutamate ligase
MVSIEYLKNKNILVFGMGNTGLATVQKLKKKIKNISAWDDNANSRNYAKKKFDIFFNKNFYKNSYDFIIMSPGINIYQHPHSSFFKNNFKKIITDIDIFISSIDLNKNKIIAITGTNGKSTFCKLLHHVMNSKKNAYLLGNYGKPVLSHNQHLENNFYILELSSYQIEYSKFLKTHACAILNITPDHLDRHKTLSNYINIKLKIFNSLLPKSCGFLNKNFQYLNRIKKNRNIIKVSIEKNLFIKNKFLNKDGYFPSISIIYNILRFFKFSKKIIITKFNSFKPLPHRQEFVRKIINITFINDSKATNFESAKFSLKLFDNIYWIAGGILKKNDSINFNDELKKKIFKTYIIGKNTSLFQSIIKNKIKYLVCKTIGKAVLQAYKDAQHSKSKNNVILLSPAAASFDQFKNFEHRGNLFKSIIKNIKNV